VAVLRLQLDVVCVGHLGASLVSVAVLCSVCLVWTERTEKTDWLPVGLCALGGLPLGALLGGLTEKQYVDGEARFRRWLASRCARCGRGTGVTDALLLVWNQSSRNQRSPEETAPTARGRELVSRVALAVDSKQGQGSLLVRCVRGRVWLAEAIKIL
jgi:hypothetical protein